MRSLKNKIISLFCFEDISKTHKKNLNHQTFSRLLNDDDEDIVLRENDKFSANGKLYHKSNLHFPISQDTLYPIYLLENESRKTQTKKLFSSSETPTGFPFPPHLWMLLCSGRILFYRFSIFVSFVITFRSARRFSRSVPCSAMPCCAIHSNFLSLFIFSRTRMNIFLQFIFFNSIEIWMFHDLQKALKDFYWLFWEFDWFEEKVLRNWKNIDLWSVDNWFWIGNGWNVKFD